MNWLDLILGAGFMFCFVGGLIWSVIAFKEFEDKIQVAFDGRVITDSDRIEFEDFKKCHKISDSLIIGVTGLADTCEIFKNFVEVNRIVFERIKSHVDGIPMFMRFKRALIEQYGFTEEEINDELGGFLVANKQYHAVYYFDAKLI